MIKGTIVVQKQDGSHYLFSYEPIP